MEERARLRNGEGRQGVLHKFLWEFRQDISIIRGTEGADEKLDLLLIGQALLQLGNVRIVKRL